MLSLNFERYFIMFFLREKFILLEANIRDKKQDEFRYSRQYFFIFSDLKSSKYDNEVFLALKYWFIASMSSPVRTREQCSCFK